MWLKDKFRAMFGKKTEKVPKTQDKDDGYYYPYQLNFP